MADEIDFDCPKCGKRYALTAEYVATYGGQEVKCDGCERNFMVPTSGMLPAAEDSRLLQYAAPEYSLTRAAGAWRDGRLLVLARGVPLPGRCVKCGGAVAVRYRVNLKWVPRMASLTRYSAMIAAEHASVAIPVCASHAFKFRLNRYCGAGLFALACVLLAICVVAGASPKAPTLVLFLLALALSATGIVWLRFARRILNPVRIDKDYIYLTGCGTAFLEVLPDIQAALDSAAKEGAVRLEQLGT